MNAVKRKLTLDRPATYQIKVPGLLDESWIEWDDQIAIAVERDADGSPISSLTGVLDQAALHGVLRRLYAIGLPLIEVNLVVED